MLFNLICLFFCFFFCRAQLGIDVDTVVRVDGVLAQHKTNQLRLAEITQQLEDTQEVQIQLRLEVGSLRTIVTQSYLKAVVYPPTKNLNISVLLKSPCMILLKFYSNVAAKGKKKTYSLPSPLKMPF